MRGIADRMLRAVARAACLGWFRSVETSRLERISWEGPLVIVANHQGGFVDPSLLTAVLPRVPRFLAMARLWDVWPIRPLLALAGAIPVRRATDGATDGNVDAFAACHQVLRAGGVVAVFPEGEASDAPHLLRVKTGAARIVLGARSHGVVGIRVVPVGLIYEAKQRARSRAFVRVGEPIAVDTEAAGDLGRGEEDRDAVRSLTHLIEARLAETSLDYRDAAQAADLWFAASVSLRRLGGSPSWSPPLSSLEGCATALARASSDAQARVREAAADYRRALEAIDATDRGVAAGRRHGRDAVRAAAALATILALPFALVGASVNAVPALLVYLSGRRPAAPVTLATVKFLVALAVFPVTWLVVREWFVASASHPWLWTAILGPGCGLVAAVVADRIRRIRQARLLPARVVLPDRAADELLERRAWLVESVADALGR